MRDADGSRSDGFRIKVLPVANETGHIHIGTMAGKLNGVMPAHTPSDCRTMWQSTPVPTFSENSPFIKLGALVANSTTSSPRVTSPSASSNVLPCSELITSAIWSMRSHNMALKRSRMRARRSAGVLLHAGHAAFAAATAAFTSGAEARMMVFSEVPIAGLKTGCVRVWSPAKAAPFMKCAMFDMGVSFFLQELTLCYQQIYIQYWRTVMRKW